MKTYGFVKVASATPKIKVANPRFNAEQIVNLAWDADEKRAALIVFPELSLTGYTCNDLFNQKTLLDESLDALNYLAFKTKHISTAILVGLPLSIDRKLYNCAVVLQQGKVLGVVPKMYLPNYKEFYEKRHFTSGHEICKNKRTIKLFGEEVPFGHLLFHSSQFDFNFGIEICEDLWVNIPPSSYLTLQGADIIANLSASNEVVGKAEYRKDLILNQSGRCMCGYIYSSSGVHESTTDIVFSGDCLIAENGSLLNRSKRFNREGSVIYADIDVEKLVMERQMNKSYADNSEFTESIELQTVELNYRHNYEIDITAERLDRIIERNPFVPNNLVAINERCEEIFNIQVAGLAKRLEHTGMNKVVIGVSGGLDSTLALLVTTKTFELLGLPSENIYGITMPGFGTTDRTYQNALYLMKSLNISTKEINIKDACIQHFKDIDHDAAVHDITYENTQARERTQLLMDISNKVGGLVIGTGDLSELALGWCTYNGDHMSMYAVNSSIPKTLVKFLVRWVADNEVDEETSRILHDIVDTPVSPELLPPDENGQIQQKTEDNIGPYELHDFFIYYVLRYGMTPEKILLLAKKGYEDKYSEEEIKKWLRVFYRRFFTQQFKRSCMPDGIKVGSVSLSPRGDWRMPSDADMQIWINRI